MKCCKEQVNYPTLYSYSLGYLCFVLQSDEHSEDAAGRKGFQVRYLLLK